MIKEYLFVDKNDMRSNEFFIIEGTSSEEAYRKAAKFFFKKDDVFMEEMSCRTVNMSFAERFWIQSTEECNYFSEKGEMLIDEKEFINRVNAYFVNYPLAANRYLSYWFLDGSPEEVERSFNDLTNDFEDFFIDEWIKFSDFNVLDILEINRIK